MLFFVLLMIRRPPRATRTDTLVPYTTLFRAALGQIAVIPEGIPEPATLDNHGLHGLYRKMVAARIVVDVIELLVGIHIALQILRLRRGDHLLCVRDQDRKSTRLNSSHSCASRMPSSACKTKNRHKYSEK